MQTFSRYALCAAAAALLVASSGCTGSSSADPAPTASTSGSGADAPAAALTVRDPWVKAADSGPTAAFGTLVNGTAQDVTVTGVTSEVSPTEMHEVAMKDGTAVMRPEDGGFVVKAGGTHELAPGDDHLMLMSPSKPIKPGDEVPFTLTLADGTIVSFTAVAKPFAGAVESRAGAGGGGA